MQRKENNFYTEVSQEDTTQQYILINSNIQEGPLLVSKYTNKFFKLSNNISSTNNASIIITSALPWQIMEESEKKIHISLDPIFHIIFEKLDIEDLAYPACLTVKFKDNDKRMTVNDGIVIEMLFSAIKNKDIYQVLDLLQAHSPEKEICHLMINALGNYRTIHNQPLSLRL